MKTDELGGTDPRKAARIYFWILLILGSSTSLYCNIAHTMSGAGSFDLNRVVGASIAPIFLVALVHGVSYLTRTSAPDLSYHVAITSVIVVATFAFMQSFGGIKGFAQHVGIAAPGLTPLIVDATTAVSTFALVVLRESPATVAVVTKRPRWHHRLRAKISRLLPSQLADAVRAATTPDRGRATPTPPAPAAESSPNTIRATAPPDLGILDAPTATRGAVGASRAPVAETTRASAPTIQRDADRSQEPTRADGGLPLRNFNTVAATADLAEDLVRTKGTRLSVDVVRAVLDGHSEGLPLNQIATTAGCHHSAAQRVIANAAIARASR